MCSSECVSLVPTFTLAAFKIFSLFCFQQFGYDVIWVFILLGGPPHFLDLWFDDFHYVWKILGHYLFKYFLLFYSFFLLGFCWPVLKSLLPQLWYVCLWYYLWYHVFYFYYFHLILTFSLSLLYFSLCSRISSAYFIRSHSYVRHIFILGRAPVGTVHVSLLSLRERLSRTLGYLVACGLSSLLGSRKVVIL